MMTKKIMFMYIVACLSMFIPAPPRFAYGIILLLIADVVLFLTVPAKAIIEKFSIKKYKTILLLLIGVSLTLFCHQILTLFSPIMALSVGFVVYLIPCSSLIFGFILSKKIKPISEAYAESVKTIVTLTLLGLLFFLLREFLAFGTISSPGMDGIIIFELPFHFLSTYSFFWSTIPGALILLAIFLVILSAIYRRKEIEQRSKK